MLHRRQPIHFGGMSDPFGPQEHRQQVTLRMLRVLSDIHYPTIISTKGTLFAEGEYLEILRTGNFAVQVSVSSVDENLVKQIDVGAPGPRALLSAAETASRSGLRVGVRIQPVLPTRENDVIDVIHAAADAGARHVAVEHLKLPIERQYHRVDQLSTILGLDLREHYAIGSTRVGREWILPLKSRLVRMHEFRTEAHKVGVAFGAADNDLLLLSDGTCCCSAADLLGFRDFHGATYSGAARRASATGRLTWSTLEEEWTPSGSIARHVNSRSRLRGAGETPADMKRYLRANWNGRANGNSPAMLFGVHPTDELDDDGMRVYYVDRAIIGTTV